MFTDVRSFSLVSGGVVLLTDALVLVTDRSETVIGEGDARYVTSRDLVLVGDQGNGRVRLWDAGSARVITSWPAAGAAVTALGLAADGRIAVGTDDERFLLGSPEGHWTFETLLERVPPGSSDLWAPCVRAAGFMGCGSALAVAGTGKVYVFDRSGRQVADTLIEDLAYADQAAVLPHSDGALVMDDANVTMVDGAGAEIASHDFERVGAGGLITFGGGLIRLASERFRGAFEAPFGTSAVAMDGEIPVAGVADGSLHWLDPDGGELLEVRQALDRAPLEVAFADDGRVAVLDGNRTLTVFDDTASLGPTRPVRSLSPSFALELGPLWDATPVARDRIAVRGDTIRVHSLPDGKLLQEWKEGEPMEVWSDDDLLVAYFRRRLVIADAQTGATRGIAEIPGDNLSLYGVLPEGLLLASVAGMILARRDGTVVEIDTGARRRGGLLHHYGCHGELSPDKKRAAVAPTDRAGILISLPDGAWIAELEPRNAAWRFSPDGAVLVDGRSGALFDGVTGAAIGSCAQQPPRLDGQGSQAAWLGNHLLRSEPGGVWLCDRDGRTKTVLSESSARDAASLCVSPDGEHAVLVGGGRLHVVRASGETLFSSKAPTTGALAVEWLGERHALLTPGAMPAADPTCWLASLDGGPSLVPVATKLREVHQDCPLELGGQVILASRSGCRLEAFSLDDGLACWEYSAADAELRSLAASADSLLIACASGRVLGLSPS